MAGEATEEVTEIEIDLGEMYVDTVTGFQGVATSRCESLHSPVQTLLENDTTHRWVEA